MIDREFEEFLSNRFPGAETTLLSSGNNSVVRVDLARNNLVVKKVIDPDIPVDYMIRANVALAEKLTVQHIVDVIEDRGVTYILSEYVAGRDVSAGIAQWSPSKDPELLSFLLRYVEACADLPRPFGGFGLFKVDAPAFGSHRDFLVSYAAKYWIRVRPFVARRATVEWIDEWVANRLENATAGAQYRTVAVDSNLRNFVRTEDGGIVLLNVPIVGYSTAAHAVASLSVHLRGSSLRTPFRQAALAELSAAEDVASLELELWQLLGVLSFYAMRTPEAPSSWRNWGGSVPLLEDLNEHIDELRTLKR